MVKTNFLLDIGYFPTGLAETQEFVPSQNISPTFWETTQAQLGFNYDSQIEAFKEDLEFDTKGIARPLSFYFGLAGSVPPSLAMPEDFDSFKVKILDNATVLAEFVIPATNQTNAQGTTTYMQFPGTGFRASTALKFQIVTTATSVTLLHG